MAQAVQYTRLGGPEVLELAEIPTPAAPADGVVVEVRAVGVNPIEYKLRSGLRPSPPITEPRRLGTDASGVIVEVGGDVSGWSVGDQVILTEAEGTYATHVVATTGQMERKPAGVSWAQAAAIGTPIGTAYQVLRSLEVGEADALLIHGGAGAVGQAAVQLARLWGATVIATASERGHARLAELGAIPVAYGPGLLERVRAAAPGGVDVILDAVGTDEVLDVSFELRPDRSRIGTVVVGARAAELGIAAWRGGNPLPLTEQEQAWRHEAVGVVADLVDRGEFEIDMGSEYPLARAADAHRELESGNARGKIILDPTARA